MKYDFKCEKCNHIFEVELKISEYEENKDKIFCSKCYNKAKRIYNSLEIKTNNGVKK